MTSLSGARFVGFCDAIQPRHWVLSYSMLPGFLQGAQGEQEHGEYRVAGCKTALRFDEASVQSCNR
jgi:hypothetical protein